MSVTAVLIGLVLAVIVYFVLSLFLASWLAGLVALLAFLAMAFGGVGTRTTTTA